MNAIIAVLIARLLNSDDSGAQGELNGIAYRLGLVTLQADAATVRRRLKAAL